MAKRNRRVSAPKSSKRKSNEGGSNRGKDYTPHLRIQDVPSTGLVARIRGWKTGRPHHLLTTLERLIFFTLEWSLSVADIREQYPLNLDRTLAIANKLGIRHPTILGTKEPVVLTTDFLITVHKGMNITEHARTAKPTDKLASQRVMEKFEIERVYWEGTDWRIITEFDVDPILATNVESIHSYRDAATLSPMTNGVIQHVESHLTPQLAGNKLPLRTLTTSCDKFLSLPSGSSLSVALHLIANRRWLVDMRKPLRPASRLTLTTA